MVSKNLLKTQLNKENQIKDLVLFIQYSDYTIKEWDKVKSHIIQNGFTITRIKNTSIVKNLIGGSYQKLESSFHGSMAIITSSQEFSPNSLKIITKIIKKELKMQLICALLHKEIVFPGTLKKWSTLPSDDELYFQLTNLLNKPVLNLINTSQKGGMMLCSDLDRYLKSEDQ